MPRYPSDSQSPTPGRTFVFGPQRGTKLDIDASVIGSHRPIESGHYKQRDFSAQSNEAHNIAQLRQATESALQNLPAWETANTHDAARKAIIVCDALVASLTSAPDRALMKRGELSAKTLLSMPWSSFGNLLGLDSEDACLTDLADRIKHFVDVVDASEADADITDELTILDFNDVAVKAVESLRAQLEFALSVRHSPITSRESDTIAEVVGQAYPKAPDIDSLTHSVVRIGCVVLVASIIGAPLGAAIFHETVTAAAAKAAIASLVASTTGEVLNYGLKSRKYHNDEAVFIRCHAQLQVSLGNYCDLDSSGRPEERDIGWAHVAADSYAAQLAAVGLDWRQKADYASTLQELREATTGRRHGDQLRVWLPRLNGFLGTLAEKDDNAITEDDGFQCDWPLDGDVFEDPESPYVARPFGQEVDDSPTRRRNPGIQEIKREDFEY